MRMRLVTLLPLFLGFLVSCFEEVTKQPCKVIPLKSRAEIRAGTVFTGTVVSFLFRRRGGGDFSGPV